MGSHSRDDDTIRAVSLFSGLGGLDIGLRQAGVETVVCVESDPDAARTLRINSSSHSDEPPESNIAVPERHAWKVIEGDIRDISADEVLDLAGVKREEIDLVVGGPPCQTFSRSNEGNRSGTDTERGKLFTEYARLLHAIRPSGFIFENVRGLASTNDGSDLARVRKRLENGCYESDYRVLNAADFGVPQSRKRLFIIGTESGTPGFPRPSHHEEPEESERGWETVGEALTDFDIDEFIEETGGYANAIGGKYGSLLKEIPEGANYQHFSERRYDPETDRYVDREGDELEEKRFIWRSRHWNYLLKADRERPSWTVQAAPGTTVGPFHWRARKFSLLEQMALQDLPLDYYVAGSPGEVQRQVGNAVPPSLAAAVARSLLDSLGIEGPQTTHHRVTTEISSEGSPEGQPPFKVDVTTEHSPWQYADKVLEVVQAERAVVVLARSRAIPYALDAIEIARRNSSEPIESRARETVLEGDECTDDCVSVLRAEVVTESAARPHSSRRALA